MHSYGSTELAKYTGLFLYFLIHTFNPPIYSYFSVFFSFYSLLLNDHVMRLLVLSFIFCLTNQHIPLEISIFNLESLSQPQSPIISCLVIV